MSELNIQVAVPLKVTIHDAVQCMSKLIENTANEIPGGVSDIHQSWDGYVNTFSFKAKGYKITGVMTVGHNWVTIVSQLPFLASMFKGRIKDTITKHAEALLNE